MLRDEIGLSKPGTKFTKQLGIQSCFFSVFRCDFHKEFIDIRYYVSKCYPVDQLVYAN